MIEEVNRQQLNNFLNNINWLREYHGLSKRQMSKVLKISVASLSKIESRIIPPRIGVEIIFNLHKSFGIKPHIIFKTDFREVNPYR